MKTYLQGGLTAMAARKNQTQCARNRFPLFAIHPITIQKRMPSQAIKLWRVILYKSEPHGFPAVRGWGPNFCSFSSIVLCCVFKDWRGFARPRLYIIYCSRVCKFYSSQHLNFRCRNLEGISQDRFFLSCISVPLPTMVEKLVACLLVISVRNLKLRAEYS